MNWRSFARRMKTASGSALSPSIAFRVAASPRASAGTDAVGFWIENAAMARVEEAGNRRIDAVEEAVFGAGLAHVRCEPLEIGDRWSRLQGDPSAVLRPLKRKPGARERLI